MTAAPVSALPLCPPRPRLLIARRLVQALCLGLFLSGPWAGLWITKGTLASSLTLGVLPLTDPLIALQSLLAHHRLSATATLGAGIVTLFYALLRGRAFCSWVCPINPLTDAAAALRRKLGWQERVLLLPRSVRLWILAAILGLSAASGTLVWELINPITMLHRDLVFPGIWLLGWPALVPLLVFLVDLLGGARLWCGHLCPVGAFYGLLGRWSLLQIRTPHRDRCDQCRACYRVCPEPHVLSPALKGATRGHPPVIRAADCTLCGRCIDVCAPQVFTIAPRFAALPHPRKD